MNVGRGLFRAWILASVLWITLGGSIIAYTIVAPDTIWGSFQPWLTDEEVGLPPWAEQKQPSRSFSPLQLGRPDMVRIEMPDGSQLYMAESLSEAVRTRIAEQFWDQRWSRWGRAAATVLMSATVTQKVRALQDATRARGVDLLSYVIDRPERIIPAIEEADFA